MQQISVKYELVNKCRATCFFLSVS